MDFFTLVIEHATLFLEFDVHITSHDIDTFNSTYKVIKLLILLILNELPFSYLIPDECVIRAGSVITACGVVQKA